MKSNWTAKELSLDLARTIENGGAWMTWCEIPLGSIFLDEKTPKADVLAIRKSFTHTHIIIYEVKIHRGDFLRDCNTGKYERYLQHCKQLYFACPTGLVKKDEVPAQAGLILRGPNGWHVVKAAPPQKFEPTLELLLKLLMRGFEDHFPKMRELDKKRFVADEPLLKAAQRLGIDIAYKLVNASQIIEDAKRLTEEVGKAMGKDYSRLDSAVWSLRSDIERMLAQKKYASDAIAVLRIADELLGGTSYGTKEAPRRLHQVADEIEAKVAGEGKEEGYGI